MKTKRHLMGMWLSLLGYLFVAVIAIIAALQVDNSLLSVLLIISAIISLILAVTRLISAKKTEERIKYLEDHHLSMNYDENKEEATLIEGI